MKIQLKTSVALRKYLPGNTPGNQVEIEVSADATPMDVITKQGFPAKENYLITLNGEIVVPSERTSRRLSEGDLLSILPPLKGG